MSIATKSRFNYKDIKVVGSSYLRSNWASLAQTVEDTKVPLLISERNVQKFAILDIDEFEDMLEALNPKIIESTKKSREQIAKGEVVSLEYLLNKYNIK